jgi:hypothetical protein
MLVTAVGGGRSATFLVDDRPTTIWIQDYSEPIGQWDSRLAGGHFTEDPNDIMPAYINRAEVAWAGTHRHCSVGGNEAYIFTHVFKQSIDLPKKARSLTLPDDDGVRILALTLADNENDVATPVQPLYDRCDATAVAIKAPRRAFVDSVMIALHSPNSAPEIHYTLDGTNPSRSSPLYRQPFLITESATVQAVAFSADLPQQHTARAEFSRLAPRPPLVLDLIKSKRLQSGLKCRYYEAACQNLPDFSTLQPFLEANMLKVSVPEFARDEDIGLVFTGCLYVPQDGLYTFYLWSDDGSALYFGDEKVIDNDGLHSKTSESADVALAEGLHPMTVTFFQHLGGIALELWWEGPGIELQPVPAASLYRLQDE